MVFITKPFGGASLRSNFATIQRDLCLRSLTTTTPSPPPAHSHRSLTSHESPSARLLHTKTHRRNGELPRLHLRNGARQGQLLLLLQDRRLPSRRPLLAKARQALVLADDPPAQPVPEPGVRPQEQDEPAADADALRRLLRGHLVRAVPVWAGRGAGCVRQQQRP